MYAFPATLTEVAIKKMKKNGSILAQIVYASSMNL